MIEERLAKKAVEKKKAATKKKKNLGGRPTVVDETVVAKLEEGFCRGLTDNEACLYAEISSNSLYRYIEKNPKFRDRKELLKEQPRMKAKLVVTDKILEKDDYNARWYLERKAKDEFSLKQEIEQNTNMNMNLEITTVSDDELDSIINS